MSGLSSTESLVIEVALLVLIVGLVIGLLVGLLALISPARAVVLTDVLSRRHSMRQSTRMLEVPISTERFFYRHHRVFGTIIVLGAAIILWYLGARFDAELLARSLAGSSQRIAAEILVETFQLVMWIGAGFSLLVGVVVFLRPSLLKGFEARANEWVSTRQASRGLTKDHPGLDRLFQAYPRAVGLVMTLGSLLGLVGLLMIRGEF